MGGLCGICSYGKRGTRRTAAGVDEHLVHACCRLMMALEMQLIQKETDRAGREPLANVYGQEIE